MPNCIICGRPLNESQYNDDETLKSCPRCSELDGEEHIYFPYPEYFGDTIKRSSGYHPDGPQSHCYSHRGNKNQPIPNGCIKCSQIK